MVVVAGEITSTSQVDVAGVVRKTLLEIGYDDAEYGIDGANCAVITTLDKQSPHIAMGVDTGGAGDQGMMFGYATDETAERMPAPIYYAHALVKRLADVRRNGTLPWVRPDGKSQVSVAYENGRLRSVDTVVVSTQHAPDVDIDTIRESIIREVVGPVIPSDLLDPDTCTFHINPTGPFRDRWASRGCRIDRAEDHRRHIRRHGPARWRRVQRKGSDQGRPVGGIRSPVGGAKPCGRRSGLAL